VWPRFLANEAYTSVTASSYVIVYTLCRVVSLGDFIRDDFLSLPLVSLLNLKLTIVVRNFVFHL
jgi:hypothetical protein